MSSSLISLHWCDRISNLCLLFLTCVPLMRVLSCNSSFCRFQCFHELLLPQTKAEVMWQVYTLITFFVSHVSYEWVQATFSSYILFIILPQQWISFVPVVIIYIVTWSSDCSQIRFASADKQTTYSTWHSAFSVASLSFSVCPLHLSIHYKTQLLSLKGTIKA